MYYNLTFHRQQALFDNGIDVEIYPRMEPLDNIRDYEEMKKTVMKAVEGIPANSDVIVGGLTSIMYLIYELPLRLWFVDRANNTVYPHEPFTRQERYKIENEILS